MAKGFGKPAPIAMFQYRAEINNRFWQTDDSEMYLGDIIFEVPEQKTRDDTHTLAILFVGCWMQSEMAAKRGANQAFLFTAKSDRYIERIEIQPFEDKDGSYRVPIADVVAQKEVKNPLSLCKLIEVRWEKYAEKLAVG